MQQAVDLECVVEALLERNHRRGRRRERPPIVYRAVPFTELSSVVSLLNKSAARILGSSFHVQIFTPTPVRAQ